MKAALSRAFRTPLSIEDVELAPPGPGEVEVRIRACAICHSDLMFISGGWGGSLPAIWGHEAAGEVVALGEGVDDLAPGDRVALTLIRACGSCACCAAGQRTYCTEPFSLSAASPIRDSTGAPVAQGLKCAAFAERATVHRSQLAPIGAQIGWAEASLLSCGVITGYGAVTNTAKMPVGAKAVVIGAGGVGLNAVQGAALAGAAPLVAVDISDDKLEIARGFGASHSVRAGETAAQEVRTILGSGADYVFVTVGATAAMESAYQMLAPGGAAVLVGMAASGEMSTFDPLTLADCGQRIIGSKMGSSVIERDIPALVRAYLAGRLKLDELVTGRFPLEDVNEALDRTRAGIGVRNVIMFD
ncbi:zinc-binding dehydrogenase [Pikeienuella piscinae]|uniref:Zinc-binding dehydrogenase n=1 Tax=Pikeienuella piscinae TaxID=2748098 RepID=A0A7L5BVA1_9RHOB|nr:zinc-binding dehydrogenase [Pikeienuella piscinae]QIE54407.1 zinc-binding dehydrogenase [Pikeienuella piscinae]